MSGDKKKVVVGVKNYSEPEIDKAQAEARKKLLENSPKEIKKLAYIYSMVDYPIEIKYNDGEEFILSPKSKEPVDKARLPEKLPQGVILKDH